jgi:AcrR family transcriptional regulator
LYPEAYFATGGCVRHGAQLAPRGPGRGRPRDSNLDARILEQTAGLLASHGYAGFTLDELATRSGVAKTTILRRWPSKAAVAAAGLEQLALQSVSVPDTGTLRGDLQEMLHAAMDTFARGRGQFVPRLIRESGHHPEITDLLFTVIHTRRQAYRRVLARALARGALSPTVDQELFIDMLIGPDLDAATPHPRPDHPHLCRLHRGRNADRIHRAGTAAVTRRGR